MGLLEGDNAQGLRVEPRHDGIFVVTMDVPGEAVNTLKPSFVTDFAAVFDAIDAEPSCRAVVFRSGKESGFVAGADLSMLARATDAASGAELARGGQRTLNRLARFRVPIVIALHGPVLGGGLEGAMACHHRIATDEPRTRLGLPEGQLGFVPGACGTQRLPRLVPLRDALEMLLTGKQLGAKRALALGLVDEVVAPAALFEAALARASSLAAAGGHVPAEPPRTRRPQIPPLARLEAAVLRRSKLARRVVFDRALASVRAKSRGHYPGLERLVEVLRIGLDQGWEAGLEAEAVAFGELVTSPVAKRLIGVFFATQSIKKEGLATLPPRSLSGVSIAANGALSSELALLTARTAAVPVNLEGPEGSSASADVRAALDERARRGSLTEQERSQVLSRLSTGAARTAEVVLAGGSSARAIAAALESASASSPEAALCSTALAVPLADVVAASHAPSRVLAMLHARPVAERSVVELLAHPGTTHAALAAAAELGRKQGRTVVVERGVGLSLLGRWWQAIAQHASALVSAGRSVAELDEAVLAAGFTAPLSGMLGALDRSELVALAGSEGARLAERPSRDALRRARGRVPAGVSSGFLLVGAAVGCAALADGLVATARDVDLVAILGGGFPPFLGGPLRFADSLDQAALRQRIDEAVALPIDLAESLRAHSARAARFYPEREDAR